jgi:hypothetical protein
VLGCDPLKGVCERVTDRVPSLCQLPLKARVSDTQRPELVEEKRPVRVALEEGPELGRGLGSRVILALGRIGNRLDLADALGDLAVGEREEELLLAGKV